ncbi:MAG: NAD-dependent protein deacetylase [Gammaproteobacteria bacterium]|nr:NAD-dependent protein deacetylase [Gammaproteobacteria bacterium]
MQYQNNALVDFLDRHESLVVVSGAGVSTASGIPDYRDRNGDWKHAEPIRYQEFVRDVDYRRRYWARSYVGWQRFRAAEPNAAHFALAELEADGRVDLLVTQNVDRLHSAAGSRRVIDLHGDLSKVRCLACKTVYERRDYQDELQAANHGWHAEVFRYKPDGDAELADSDYCSFVVSDCLRCGGIVKPHVVMFGESVPKTRVAAAMESLERAAALLVVGSSLMLYSGFRFARHASELEKPIAIVNQGRTRADSMATVKIDADCGQTLQAALEGLSA